MSESPSISVLVVDDELYARERLFELLSSRDEVEDVDSASSGSEAVEALRTSSYDLLFLDVQMPERTGLEVIETIGPSNMPPTIFVTAYDEYALQAFEYAALDYLLKPFDDDRFEEAFQRGLNMRSLHEAEAVAKRFHRLLDAPSDSASNLPSPTASDGENRGASSSGSQYLERLTVDLPGKVRVIPVGEIHYIAAEEAYVKVHTDGDNYLLRERMHVLEDCLSPSDFARIHRSTIVRLDLIETVLHSSGGDYAVRLKTGKKLAVSRSRREDLLAQLQTGTS